MEVEIRVQRGPARYRPVDVPVVYGSAEKFRLLGQCSLIRFWEGSESVSGRCDC